MTSMFRVSLWKTSLSPSTLLGRRACKPSIIGDIPLWAFTGETGQLIAEPGYASGGNG